MNLLLFYLKLWGEFLPTPFLHPIILSAALRRGPFFWVLSNKKVIYEQDNFCKIFPTQNFKLQKLFGEYSQIYIFQLGLKPGGID